MRTVRAIAAFLFGLLFWALVLGEDRPVKPTPDPAPPNPCFDTSVPFLERLCACTPLCLFPSLQPSGVAKEPQGRKPL